MSRWPTPFLWDLSKQKQSPIVFIRRKDPWYRIRDIISYHIVYHIISYIISYHIISYHIISYHTIPYHIISYHTISYHIMLIPGHLDMVQTTIHMTFHIFISRELKFVLWLKLLCAWQPVICLPTWQKISSGRGSHLKKNVLTMSQCCLNYSYSEHQYLYTSFSWWRHQMDTFSALLAFCAGNSPVPIEFPHKGQWRGALIFSSMPEQTVE